MKVCKRIIALFLSTMIISTTLFATTTSDIDVARSNKLFVALRDFCEKYDYEIKWNDAKKIATIKNEKNIEIDVQALIKEDKAYIENNRVFIDKVVLDAVFEINDVEKDEMTYEQRAVKIAEHLKNAEYQEVCDMMDDNMLAIITPSILKQSYETVAINIGEIKDIKVDKTIDVGEYKQVDVRMTTELAQLKITLVFNQLQKLSGLQLGFYAMDAVLPKHAVEKEMSVTSGKYTMPATLTLPKQEGDFPVVVLVHGSGPNDQDETIGGVKVFRDIAYFLAEKGIATLRYDKRTYTYIKEYNENPAIFDFAEEVLEDAQSAVELMKVTPQIDKDKIFVLGHSLGGMSVPMLNKLMSGVSGYIMMAAPARPLEDLVYEQIDYLTGVQGMSETEKTMYMELINKQIQVVKTITKETEIQEVGLAGINNKMWADFNAYNQVEDAKSIDVPLLIVQGGRDYQVTMEDYEIWQEMLNNKENVTFRAYDDLNHLFVTGAGKSIPNEYYTPAQVSETFLLELTQWILNKGLEK
ncbi:MAG: DUF3887 domain-containing protein [Cellulosilyticaceae bacterium]